MRHQDLSAARRARIDGLADDIATLAASIAAATHRLLCAIRQFDDERGWALQGAKSLPVWLCWRTGCAPHTAREWVRCARALEALPKMNDALAKGAVSYSKVRAMTRVATPDNEDLLLAQAKTATGDRLEKVCASFRSVQKKLDPTPENLTDDDHRYVHRRIRADGTVVLTIRVLPDEADTLMAAIRATKAQLEAEASPKRQDAPGTENVPAGTHPPNDSKPLAHENVPAGTSPASAHDPEDPENVPAGTPPTFSLADAAVAMAHRQLAALAEPQPAKSDADDPNANAKPVDADEPTTPTRTPSATRRELLIHLRHSDLVDGAFAAELHDGTPLDGATFCRLACDTGVVVAHLDDQGEPLDVGRRRRTIPPALMRALLIRDMGCAFPGCQHQAFVEAHHLQHWAHGGPTHKNNLVLLCHPHHLALHEGGFTAERLDDGSFLFRDPLGRPIPHHPQPPPAKPTPPIHDPKTNLIQWDGRPMNLHGAVSALVNRQLGCNH